jgi:glucosylceramidase
VVNHLRVAPAVASRVCLAACLGLAALASCGRDAAPRSSSSVAVHVWLTTPDLTSRLSRQTDVAPAGGGPADVTFDDTVALQTIDGFGAAFTDSSASLIWGALAPAARDALIAQLFSRTAGIGLSFMRVPMGSSDFSACACTYSYDDSDQPDPTLSGFSTAHDDQAIIPLIRQAQTDNPQMKLFANPWSPPAWMKTNGSMLGGGDGALRDDAHAALAQYFVRFLQDYQAKGVSVWGITPQNEPAIAPSSYSGMLFPAADEAQFIAEELTPALAAAGLTSVKIRGGDDVGASLDFADTLYASAASSLFGTAWHCYQGLDDMTAIHAEHPDQPLYVTECSTGPTGIAGDATQQTLAAMSNWASGVALWNLALDPDGGPKMGTGCTGCTGLVTVDPSSGQTAFTINYYELGQFSKFVAPGATRVASTEGAGLAAAAFRNPDGTDALVVFNPGADAVHFSVAWPGAGTFDETLPAGATVTFTTADL